MSRTRTLLKVRARKVRQDRVYQDRGAGLNGPSPRPSADLGKREISPESIAAHALATFGSMEKARHWLNRPNTLFSGKTPSQVMQVDPVGVEAELVRIDHGVYV